MTRPHSLRLAHSRRIFARRASAFSRLGHADTAAASLAWKRRTRAAHVLDVRRRAADAALAAVFGD